MMILMLTVMVIIILIYSKALVAAGADIDHKDTWGWTPLMYESKYLTSIPHLLRLVRFQTFPWCLEKKNPWCLSQISTATSPQMEIYKKNNRKLQKNLWFSAGRQVSAGQTQLWCLPRYFQTRIFEDKKS